MTQQGHTFDDEADHAGDSDTSRARYEYDVAFNDWLDRNPIKQHRTKITVWSRNRKRVLSQSGLANRLEPQSSEGEQEKKKGRAPLTIQNWESGTVTPKDDGFAALAQFFGDPDIKEKWLNWHRQKPVSPIPHMIQEEMASEDSEN